MSPLREVMVLLALAACGAVATHFLHPRAPRWYETQEPLRNDEVDMDTIEQRWHGDVLWIDARPRAHFEKAHIPGALLINEQELEAQLVENIGVLQDNQKPVVVYCDSGGCQASRKIRDYLAKNLPTQQFYVLRGGWDAWLRAHR